MIKKFVKSLLADDGVRRIKKMWYRYFGGNQVHIGKGNILELNDATLIGCLIDVKGQNCIIQIGGTLRNSKIRIFGDNCHIIIGNNNLFNDSIFWLEDSNSCIYVGDNNQLCGKVHMGVVEGTSLTIRNGCLFSSEIYISTTDSHSIIDLSDGKRVNPSKDVVIGNHVWVGHKVTIGKGVNIADDVIIGGMSFVSKSINKSHVIAAGVPAKIIKEGLSWNEKRINNG